ncbi:acetyltransferase (GNAT) family protein [Streptomyces sp. 846.5]|nr:GNAT family N-acetyltransferase [Streptomyces sp. 846.5]TDU03003.1 acetyltransferase (GNAT) family protein [Streptomyces sp. 846.5]
MCGVTHVDLEARSDLLERLEHYYDAVPRTAARIEEYGPLTLFVREGEGFAYYARPSRAASTVTDVTADDVRRVRDRQRELGVPESFEWVAETTPGLREAVEETGLVVHECPLMVLDSETPTPVVPERADGVVLRIVGADDPVLPSALALLHVAFGEPGTGVGAAGVAELDEAVRSRSGDRAVELTADRIRRGLTVVAAAVESGRALCSGRHQPVGEVSEIVGVGTLPSARRRGLGQALTATLVADARSRSVRTVFLSAGDEDVARVYARLGFRRVGTALIAEPDQR